MNGLESKVISNKRGRDIQQSSLREKRTEIHWDLDMKERNKLTSTHGDSVFSRSAQKP